MIRLFKKTAFALITMAFGANVYAANLPEAKIIPYNNEGLVVDLGDGQIETLSGPDGR